VAYAKKDGHKADPFENEPPEWPALRRRLLALGIDPDTPNSGPGPRLSTEKFGYRS
jgi:hypothetical protein